MTYRMNAAAQRAKGLRPRGDWRYLTDDELDDRRGQLALRLVQATPSTPATPPGMRRYRKHLLG